MIIEIKPAQDAYTWSVEYHNGVIVPEFDDEKPEGRGWAEIDSSQVKYVRLHQGGWPAHNVTVPDGAEPVFTRRRKLEMDMSTNEQKLSTMHCIGWKRDNRPPILTRDAWLRLYPEDEEDEEEPQEVYLELGKEECYLFVCEDGSTLLTSDFQAV